MTDEDMAAIEYMRTYLGHPRYDDDHVRRLRRVLELATAHAGERAEEMEREARAEAERRIEEIREHNRRVSGEVSE